MSTKAEIEAAETAFRITDAKSEFSDDVGFYKAAATAAIAASEPLIRERLAQRVEAEQKDATDRAMNYALSGDSTSHALALLRAETFGVAASIIRGDS